MSAFLKCVLYFSRSNEDSFQRGVVSKESYDNKNKRSLITLKICFMSWLYEFIGIGFAMLTPTLKKFGFYYLYYPDAILIFVVIPLLHIINDEDTKSLIIDEGWIQAIKFILNIRSDVEPQGVAPIPQRPNENQN